MTDLGSKGFRVQVTERRSGRSYDLRHSGLSYEAGLPGGFKTCVFTCATQDCSGPDRNVDYLDDIVVFYGDDVAWEGQVEEVAPEGRVVVFTCLGPAVTLKDQPLGVLFVDRQYERWNVAVTPASATSLLVKQPTFISFTAPTLNASDGPVAEWSIPQQALPLNAIAGATYVVYVPPYGALVRYFAAVGRGSANLDGGVTPVYWDLNLNKLDGDANDPNACTETLVSILMRNRINLPQPTRNEFDGLAHTIASVITGGSPFISLDFGPHRTGPLITYNPGQDVYVHWYNQVVLGELHPDTGATMVESDMTVDKMIRSVLATRIQVPRVRSSEEAIAPGRYLVQQATFDESTPETIIQRLCDLVGWEWGVFDGRRMYAGPPETVTALGFRDPAVFDAPPWYMSLRAEDGHNIMVAESAANVINQVQMKTVGKATGIRYETVYTNFNDSRCPLNQPGSTPLEIRSRVVDAPEGFGQDDIAVYAAALLARFAAPQITGEVVISQPLVSRVDMGTTTPFLIGVSEIGGPDTLGGRPMEFQTTVDAPLIRPGWWCHFPDLDTTLDESAFTIESGRRPMGGLGMVRNVAVEAGDGGAVVTLTLDDGSTRFDTAVAQFIEGRI